MKLYKIKNDILVQHQSEFYLLNNQNWDEFVNDDQLYEKVARAVATVEPLTNATTYLKKSEAPIGNQEIWASGVTYYRSKLGREEESKETGGGDFYDRVYHAARPELFFKASAHRAVGHGGLVGIRNDSTWDVPEPELTLVITSSGKIVGYTIGNDMSSRSIEGENPLYLPQAKTYDGSAAVGPCIYLTNKPLPQNTLISMEIIRNGSVVFEDEVGIDQIKRDFEELVEYLYRECSFPYGSLLMTGTGIVPGNDFTLRGGDLIRIQIEPIGVLENRVRE